MATEGKAYSVTVHLTKVETQPTIYKVTYDANGGAWDWSFSKDGYNLNATSGADKLTKDNASGEETLELLRVMNFRHVRIMILTDGILMVRNLILK